MPREKPSSVTSFHGENHCSKLSDHFWRFNFEPKKLHPHAPIMPPCGYHLCMPHIIEGDTSGCGRGRGSDLGGQVHGEPGGVYEACTGLAASPVGLPSPMCESSIQMETNALEYVWLAISL